MTHPFITAMQEALDTHGLPSGVTSVHVGTSTFNPSGVYCIISLGDFSSRSQPTLADAMAAAQAAYDAHAADEAARDMARAVLEKAGLDPALVKS